MSPFFYFLSLSKPLSMKFLRQFNIFDLVFFLQPMRGRYVVQAAGIADSAGKAAF